MVDLLTREPQDPLDVIAGTAHWAPPLTSEDAPVALAVYARMFAIDGYLVSGSRKDGRKRGKRWGMSASWDGQTPHLRLPQAALLARPPAAGLYVTGAPYFDFIYRPAAMQAAAADSRWRRKAQGAGVVVEQVRLEPRAALAVFYEARTLHGPDELTQAAAYAPRLQRILEVAPQFAQIRTYGTYAGGRLVAWQMTWTVPPLDIWVKFYALPDYRWVTRHAYAEQCRLSAAAGCELIDCGDAYNLPGLARFKFELQPCELRAYYDVWDGPAEPFE